MITFSCHLEQNRAAVELAVEDDGGDPCQPALAATRLTTMDLP